MDLLPSGVAAFVMNETKRTQYTKEASIPV
jgi:hypothetical protein